jgi:dihydrofolate synthase/folylpolyglutamate synthase
MNYNETLNYIHSLGNFSKPPTLERINAVLEKLGNPQNDFKAIHIAGTNGKGSVSAMLNSVLKRAGYKTGLYISPFIIDFCERIQINGEFIPRESLCEFSQKVIDTKIELTEFEFITAVAFLFFSSEKCDIAVIETGLGGRLDATNSITHVVANVITKIGLDHTAILGDSIEQITKEKCGIIKNCPVITCAYQPKEASEILSGYNPIIPDIAELKMIKSDIFGNEFCYKGEIYKTTLSGEYQIENALVVIETLKTLGIANDTIKQGIEKTFFPARMEVISRKPIVLLDGAHNIDGATVLAREMAKFSGKITALIGMMADKDCDLVLQKTLPYCKRAVAVEVSGMPRSLNAEELKQKAQKYCETETAKNYDEAIDKIKDNDVIFVFGSLYLASAVRDKLKIFFDK